ncbi:MAG TPA: hypothetical protein QGH84_07915, partial [Rhodospirillales bacterium]|nr:hypothetical protein [Rhodospirillales bacterium]
MFQSVAFFMGPGCPSSKHLGRLSLFRNRGSGPSWFGVKPLVFFYSSPNLTHTYAGIIMAHAMLGIPFVVITVTATLVGFDHSLTR